MRSGRAQAAVVREALTEYVARQHRPRPKSIGIVRDLTAAAAREAKRATRRERERRGEERRARRG